MRGAEKKTDPGVAQLVARVVWDHQAAGSNPVTRTSGTLIMIRSGSLCFFQYRALPVIMISTNRNLKR